MAQEHRQEGGGSRAKHSPGPDPVEHGKPATYDPKTGEVHGSGSGAGGGGNPREDHDGDPMAGAGHVPQGDARPIEEGVERPIDPDEGA
ncbi:MAG TPA: hypothetical protein VGB48_04665 [Allosphingosinicella sp.]|jgi:hypothetical protein